MNDEVKPLPKWAMHRYSKLWNKFGEDEFLHEHASSHLNQDKMLSIVLSKLKQSGWIEIRIDPQDSRKRLYKLRHPELVIKSMGEGKVAG